MGESEASQSTTGNVGRLLDKHVDSRYNARLNVHEPVPGPNGIMLVSDAPNDFSTYAEGYKKLADLGVQQIANGHHHVDVLVYPIVFCYRQYMELRLKELIRTAGDLLDQSLIAPNLHDLPGLWTHVRALLRRIWPGEDPDLDAIESVVEEFQEIDPRSDAFRYPLGRSGNPSLPGLKYINVRQVSEVIGRIAPTLDGASYAIEEFLDNKQETQAEAWQEAIQHAEPPDNSPEGA